MGRRVFAREFKIEAVRLIRDRGVSVAQAARDLEIHENMLQRWAKELSADLMQAFPGHGQEKPERLEIERLRKEYAKLRAERDILKKAARSGVSPGDHFAPRLRAGDAISESVLCDSNRLRRHSRVAEQHNAARVSAEARR